MTEGQFISSLEKAPKTPPKGSGCLLWTFLGDSPWEHPRILPQTRCWKSWAYSGRLLRHALGAVTWPKGERELCHKMELHAKASAQAQTFLCPLPCVSQCPRSGWSSCYFHCSSGRGTSPTLKKGPLTHDSWTPEKQVPQRMSEWETQHRGGPSSHRHHARWVTSSTPLLVLLPPLLRVNEYSKQIHTDLQKLDMEGYHSNREGGVRGERLLLQHMLAPSLQEQKGPSHNVYLVRGRRGQGTPWEEYRDGENKKYPPKCVCGRFWKRKKKKKKRASTQPVPQ